MPAGQQEDFAGYEAARKAKGLRGVVDRAREQNAGIDLLAGAIPGVSEGLMSSDIANAWEGGSHGTAMGLGALSMLPWAATIKKVGGAATDAVRALRGGADDAERALVREAAPIYDVNGVPIDALSKSEQTKYDKAIKASPAFRKMEAARTGETILEDTHQFSEPNIIQFEDLLNKRGIPIHGDRTAAGKRLTRLNGIDIPGGVELQGGAPYAHMHGDLDTGYGWASMGDAANKKQTHFKNAAHDTDTDVMGIYTTMGMDGLNFSHMPTEAMVKILREMPMNKAMTKEATDEIRHFKKAGNFVGLDSEYALDQLMGQNGFPMRGAGAMRKALIETLSKAKYQKAGAPNYFDMMNAMTDPNLGHNVPVGTSGYAVIKGDPNAKTISAANVPDALRHKTYDTVIPGEYQGRMVEQIPDEIMFPSVFKRMREQGKTGLHRAFSIGNKDYQDFNEQWLEGVLNYLRQNGQR